MNPASDLEFMEQALGWARRAAAAGEIPVGAVVVVQDKVIAGAGNSPITLADPTAHAEMLVLRQAARSLGNYRLGSATLYCTLEPCVMCAGALVHARISRLVFGARDLRFGGVRSKFRVADSDLLNHQVQVVEGVLGPECLKLLKEFFENRR